MNDVAESDLRFASPFFRAEYIRTLAQVREGVHVVLIHDGDRMVGCYPFERVDNNVGRPVGGGMSNNQAVVAEPGTPWSVEQIARAAGVQRLTFHHQICEQSEFDPYITRRAPAPIINLTGGWEGYLAQRETAGISSFNALPRKMRRLEREVGPVRFVPHVEDPQVFEQLITWKRAQYSTGSLHQGWAIDALQRLMRIQTPGFSGMLSALYAGDRLMAVHAGIRSRHVWHYWYPAYDPDMGRHSPGLVLIWEMCRWAAESGLDRIDLGPGEGAHKDLFATSATTIGVGEIVIPQETGVLWRLRNLVRAR